MRVKDRTMIDEPPHYTINGIEAIDVIRAKLTLEEYRGYCKGAALKYLMRANYKGHHDEDVSKASWYLIELESALDEESNNAKAQTPLPDPAF